MYLQGASVYIKLPDGNAGSDHSELTMKDYGDHHLS